MKNVYEKTESFHALPDTVKEAYHFSKDKNQRCVAVRSLGLFSGETLSWRRSCALKLSHDVPSEVTHQPEAPPPRPPAPPASRGWVPLFDEPAYEPGTVAHVTSFDLARDLPKDDPRVLRGERSMGQNVWPRESEVPGFKRDVTQFYDATSSAARVRRPAEAPILVWRWILLPALACSRRTNSGPARTRPASGPRRSSSRRSRRCSACRGERGRPRLPPPCRVSQRLTRQSPALPRASSLPCSDAFLRHWSAYSRGTMRLMRYPGGISADEANVRNFGIAAHTDFEARLRLIKAKPSDALEPRRRRRLRRRSARRPPCVPPQAFTLLHQDAPGLQLQTAEGGWEDAPVPALGAQMHLGSTRPHFGAVFRRPFVR